VTPALLAQWALQRVVRFPWFWLWAIALAALGPLAHVFLPLATTTRDMEVAGLLYEIVFLALLAGAVAGLRVVQEAPYLLFPLDPVRRLAVESAVLTTTAGAFLVVGLLPLAIAQRDLGLFLRPELAVRGLLTHLHLLAASLLLLRLPVPPTARLLLLPALVWVVPAAVAGRSNLLTGLVQLLDASAPLSAPGAAFETRDELLGSLLALRPILALFLAAALLRPPPLPHALRHPG
jgi:hypothetical protein